MSADKFIQVKAESKAFVCIGTSEIANWAVDSTPFIIPMVTFEDFDEQGFAVDEFNKCLQLEVGEICNSFDYEGIYVMRVQ